MPYHKGKMVNDVQVVAAFNSCLDLTKWNALPYGVKDRFKNLLRHNRVKMVCFADELGVGLRIYRDGEHWETDGGDEATLKQGVTEAEVDLDGFWVRCPTKMWDDLVNTPPPEQFMVMHGHGGRYYPKNLVGKDLSIYAQWGSVRSMGQKFDSREAAQEVADQWGGVVVRAETPKDLQKMKVKLAADDDDDLDDDEDEDTEDGL